MDWWGYVLTYLGVGILFVPLDCVFTYHTYDRKRERVHADPELEIRRLRAEAAKTFRWSLLCIPCWPFWILIFLFVSSSGLPKMAGNLIAKKDIERLEQEIAEEKAKEILERAKREAPRSWQQEFEGRA